MKFWIIAEFKEVQKDMKMSVKDKRYEMSVDQWSWYEIHM